MDHTKKTTFAAFTNSTSTDKFWVNGHFEFDTDSPTLFRYNTKEEKAVVKEVAQSYLDHWNMKNIELVVFEMTSRQVVKLTKRSEEEIEAERLKNRAKIEAAKAEDANIEVQVSEPQPVEPEKKRRGRKPKGE